MVNNKKYNFWNKKRKKIFILGVLKCKEKKRLCDFSLSKIH